jgi:outer membrane receptor for ferrienterochelin and colicin
LKLIKSRLIACVAAALLAGAGIAGAQETTTGSIAGEVRDAQGGTVPGATVTITSSQGTKAVLTDASGRFFAPYLTPGLYGVKVDLTGFSSVEQKGVRVRLGARVDLAFTLKMSAVQEVVEVVGEAPVVDVSSTSVGTSLDSDALKRLPVGRQFFETLYLAAGVASGGGAGKANPSIRGASGLENAYIVDGVNITNQGYGALGTYSAVHGTLGNGVTSDFIEETQIKSAGFEAEYGQATGGVVNVVTRSGTNDLRGSVFGYFRPAALEGEYEQTTTPNGTVNRTGSQLTDVGVTLGGPLVKDRLFFFGAVNPQFQRESFVAPEGFPLRSLGEVDRKRRIVAYAGKLTYQLSSNHRLDLSLFGDPSHGDNGPQRANALRYLTPTGFSELASYGGHNQTLRWDGVMSRHWLVEASISRAQNKLEEVPEHPELSQIRDRRVVPSLFSGGVGFYDQKLEGKSVQYQLKSTNIFELGGHHQLRYGVLYEDIDFAERRSYSGEPFTLPDGQRTMSGPIIDIRTDPSIPQGYHYRIFRATFTPGAETTQRYLSFFVQDSWQLGNVTLRPGLRYEQQKLVGDLTEVEWDGNWAPRIGAAWDVRGDGKAKLYANWARFYAKIPNDLAVRALSQDATATGVRYYDVGLSQPIPGTAVTIFGTEASHVDENSRSTYADEFGGGFEVEARPGLNLGVRYSHRSLGRILEDVQIGTMVLNFTGECPEVDGNYVITNPSASTRTACGVGAFEEPTHDYDAVEITADKRFSRNWSLIASYRWSRLRGNFEGFYRNDNGQSDPAISSLFDFPTNDPTFATIGHDEFGFRGDIRYQGIPGPLPNDRTHQLKLYGNYTFGGANVGVGFNAISGKPLTALAANPAYNNPGEIPETERGGGFETVDGFRTRTPFETTLDLSADYTFKLGDRQRLVLVAAVFNVFDRQEATDYDNFTELVFGVSNPDFGTRRSNLDNLQSFQTPRQIRLGARLEW